MLRARNREPILDDALLRGLPPGADRRTAKRYEANLPIAVQAVTDDLAPAGDLYETFTADLSQGGVRFFNTKPIVAQLVVVSLTKATGEPLRLLATIVRCKRNGVLFELAARFIRKLDVAG